MKILIIVVIGAIAFAVFSVHLNKNSGNELGIIFHSKARHIEGVGDFLYGVDVNIFCYEDKIGFDITKYPREHPLYTKKAKSIEDNYQLAYERIKKVDLKRLRGRKNEISLFSIVYITQYEAESTAKFALRPSDEFLFKPLVNFVMKKVGQEKLDVVGTKHL